MNGIYCMDALEGLKLLNDESIDMIITSPPYDNLRKYNGFTWDFEGIAKQLYRVLKNGGVMVWVVGDQVINRSESGSSFRQALYFKEIGFNLHDTMIYEKNSASYPSHENSLRYTQIFEYMFILSKGKPKTVNLICDKQNKWAGFKDFSGKLKNPVKEFSPRNNIWKFTTSFNNKYKHPAPFPLQLALDHITSWSNAGDSILDPFMGSGTSAIASIELGRKWVGFEISEEYVDSIKKRIELNRSE